MSKHSLSDYTDMSKEELDACCKKINMEKFMQDPTKAFSEAGITFKKGITFKFVENEAEKNALPSNVIPLKRPNMSNKQLSGEELDRVAGGGFMMDLVHLIF